MIQNMVYGYGNSLTTGVVIVPEYRIGIERPYPSPSIGDDTSSDILQKASYTYSTYPSSGTNVNTITQTTSVVAYQLVSYYGVYVEFENGNKISLLKYIRDGKNVVFKTSAFNSYGGDGYNCLIMDNNGISDSNSYPLRTGNPHTYTLVDSDFPDTQKAAWASQEYPNKKTMSGLIIYVSSYSNTSNGSYFGIGFDTVTINGVILPIRVEEWS